MPVVSHILIIFISQVWESVVVIACIQRGTTPLSTYIIYRKIFFTLS